jgi:predicted O-linked N-acetylglucosamine transferase (SPINDLY family)
MDTIEMMERAMAAYQAGRDEEAQTLCDQVVALEEDNPDAQYVLGMIAYRRKDLEAAEAYLRRAIGFERSAYWFHAALAEVLLARQKPEQAAEALREASELAPDSPEIAHAVATMLQQYGSSADQAPAWRRVVELAPQNVEAMANLGRALVQTGKPGEAIEVLRKSLAIDPQHFDANLSMAVALNNTGRHADALERAQHAIAIRASDPQPYHALAAALAGVKRYDEAVDAVRRALELEPRFRNAHDLLTILLANSGHVREAIEQWKRFLAVFPHDAGAHSNLLVTLNYLPDLSREQIFDAHRRWATTYADPFGAEARQLGNTPEINRRLRIGYVSPDFYRHPVAYFMKAIFAAHHQDKYEVVAFADVPKPDQVTMELKGRAGKWLSIVGKNNAQVAELARFEGIDVLIDLTGHTAKNRLGAFALRAAPVQISYLGYCNTTGMTAMDWIVGDEVTDPPDDTQPYVEKLLRVPGCFCCYTPEPDAAEVNDLPAASGRPLTLGAFHALRKISEPVLDLWARVLRELPLARLLIWRTYLTPRAQARLRDEFGHRGVDAQRLEFRDRLPQDRSHLSIYHDVDLALDAFPWSGHTTSCESLWMGVPLVTLRGNTHCGRMAASTLTAAGFGRFVADSQDDYLRIVKELAGDLPALAELRRTMRATTAASPLCDGARFIVGWERALRDAWKTWCQAKRSYE